MCLLCVCGDHKDGSHTVSVLKELEIQQHGPVCYNFTWNMIVGGVPLRSSNCWINQKSLLWLKENGSAEQQFEVEVISTLSPQNSLISSSSAFFLPAPPWVWRSPLSMEKWGPPPTMTRVRIIPSLFCTSVLNNNRTCLSRGLTSQAKKNNNSCH